MKNIIKYSSLLLSLIIGVYAQMLRYNNENKIEEIKFSALNPDEFEIIFSESLKDKFHTCQSLILNENHSCLIQQVQNNTVTCSFPFYEIEEGQRNAIQNCKATCSDQPGCSLLQFEEDFKSFDQKDEKQRILAEEVDPFSFSPTSASFVYPSYIKVDLMSLNKKVSKVLLLKDTLQKEVIILSQNTKRLICLLKGQLKAGDYNMVLQTEDNQKVQSKAVFKIMIQVDSVSPIQGTIEGGVLLTITGDNFSLVGEENKVRISTIDCLVISSNKTEIQCITKNGEGIDLNKKFNVEVYNEDQVSIASENAKYSFIQVDKKPKILTIGSNFKGNLVQGETVVITGEYLQIEGQETVLRIGEFVQEYSNLTPSSLSFIVGFDMPNFQQDLTIHVGIYGATEKQTVVAPVMLKNSICISKDKGLFRQCYEDSSSRIYCQPLYFDLELYNYDSIYQVIITYDKSVSFEMKVDQSISNKNILYVRTNEKDYGNHAQITSIKVGDDEILESPIPITIIESQQGYLNIFKTTQFIQISETATYFGIQFEPNENDLSVYQVQIRTSDYGLQFLGTINQGSFSFNKLPKLLDFSSIILEGCSNKGRFEINLSPAEFIFEKPVEDKVIILENPFTDGIIFPGQKFKAQFIEFSPMSDFLCLACNGVNYPLFSETSYNSDLIHSFTIPPIFTRNDGSQLQQCILTHRSQWTKIGDQFTTPYILYENNLQAIQKYITTYTANESLSSITVNYNLSNDIIISSITPQSLSYTGDEIFEMRGANLKNVQNEEVSVKINNVDCLVLEAKEQVIKCMTQMQEKIQNLEQSSLVVYIKGTKVNVQVLPTMVYRQIDPLPLSDLFNFKSPSSKMFIPKFYSMIMDDIEAMNGKTVSYDRFLIDGSLFFIPSISYAITLNRLIGYGSLLIGTQNSPFDENTFKLTVLEETNIAVVSAFSSQKQVFMNLSETASKGQKIIKIAESQIGLANLKVGDVLVITGTTIDSEYETVNIASINKNQITLVDNLAYDHICAQETIKTKDQTSINFKINPTVTKINKNVIFDLQNIEKQYNELNLILEKRVFTLSGVQFKFNQANTSAYYKYYLSVSDSILDIKLSNLYSYFCSTIQSLENNLILNQELNCYSLDSVSSLQIKNNVFLAKQYNKIVMFNFNQVDFIDNVFQKNTLASGNKQNGNKNQLKGNVFYNTDLCLLLDGSIYMENNICFSCLIAIKTISQNYIQSPDYYFIAVQIQYAAIEHSINSYSTEDFIKGKALFKSNFNPSSMKAPPLVLKSVVEYYINALTFGSYQNLEFIGFNYSASDPLTLSLPFPYWNIVKFSSITQDFNQNSIIVPSDSYQIINDFDGSFSGIGKQSNIFSSSLNLHEDTSFCTNKEQYSICQNKLAYFGQIALWHLYQDSSNSLSLKRQNNKIIDGNKIGFFVVLGEQYEAAIKDSQPADVVLQMSSMTLSYSQDSEKSVIISYKLGKDYLDHTIISDQISSLKDLLFISDSNKYPLSSTDINQNTCKHGDSYYNNLILRVCYKQLYSPVTIVASYYPEVYPQISKLSPSSKIKDFQNENDWIELGRNYKTESRWSIRSHWKMEIKKGGKYDIPSLVIQGELVITGKEDIIINTRGIYIGAGSITVSPSFTGSLTINFISKDKDEIIFNNPYESSSFKEGSLVINNKITIENNSNTSQTYRVRGLYENSQQKLIVEGLDKNSQISKGDDIIIVSPQQGESLLTKIVSFEKYDRSSTLVVLQDAYTQPFNSFDNLKVGSRNILLSPYLKIFKRRIQFNNAKITTLSHGLSYIPEIIFKGITFVDSKIVTSKAISKVTIENCTFISDKISSDSYFVNEQTIIYYSGRGQSQTISPVFSFSNNLFYKSQNPISIQQFYNYQVYNEQYSPISYNSNIQYKINLQQNIILDSNIGFYTYYPAQLSNNIIVKASDVCLSTELCLINNNDLLMFCKSSGIRYNQQCNTVQNLFVAFSGTFFDGKINLISNVVSIANDVHFKPFAGNFNKNFPLNIYDVTVSQSIVISDLVNQENILSCKQRKAIQLFNPQSDQIQVTRVTIKDCIFSNMLCSKVITFNDKNDVYHSQVAFFNTPCYNCVFQDLTDMIDTSSISSVPPSFLVQDFYSIFLSQQSNTPNPNSYIFTQQQEKPFIKVENKADILARLFIRSIGSDNSKTYQLTDNAYNTQVIENRGTIFVFTLNKIYSLTTESYNQIALRISSHNVQQTEYSQIRLKVGKERGLRIRQDSTLLLPTPDLDTSQGYDIMKMVNNKESNIKCGLNVYDPALDEYHIILTNDNNCLIELFEYSTAKVFIVIPTPILPPPPPEEQNMCLAQRQALYVINRISSILGIDKRRIKLLAQSGSNSCTLNRILQDNADGTGENLSFTFFIDPESNTDDQNSCTFNPSCSPEQKKAEEQQQSTQNMATFDKLQNLQEAAVEAGFVISKVESSLPSISITTCPLDKPLYKNQDCVADCGLGYYPKDNKVCVKCNLACKNCIDLSSQKCTQLKDKELDCAESYSTFSDSNGILFCGKCPSNCKLSCSSLSSPQCPENQCNKGYVNQNGFCVQKCAANFFNWNNEGVCKKCQANCKNGCQDGTCVCNNGYFYQSNKDQVCAPCSPDCATCENDNECLTCKKENFIPKFQCQVEKQVQESESDSNFGLIIGLTFGICGAVLSGIFIFKIIKSKMSKQSKYIPTSDPNIPASINQISVE